MFDTTKKNKRQTFGIILLFVILVSYVVYTIINIWFEEAGIFAAIIALSITILGAWGSYYNSDKIILSLNGARPATKEENQRMYESLEGLCIAAGLPMPKLYIMDDDSLNAFATGRDPEHSVICVTRGLMNKLDSYEMEGVLGHELSHIKNYDIRLQTIAAIFVGFVTILSDFFLRVSIRNSGRRSSNKSSGGEAIMLLIGLIFLVLSPIFAKLLQFALSRKREYLADASAIELTRNPEGLIKALQKISVDTDPLEQANKSSECLYISCPFKNKTGTKTSWFSTHPPIEARIEALKNIH